MATNISYLYVYKIQGGWVKFGTATSPRARKWHYCTHHKLEPINESHKLWCIPRAYARPVEAVVIKNIKQKYEQHNTAKEVFRGDNDLIEDIEHWITTNSIYPVITEEEVLTEAKTSWKTIAVPEDLIPFITELVELRDNPRKMAVTAPKRLQHLL